MTIATGPAWAALVAATRTSEHGAQVYRDAYEAGRADERAGRGGRARYRRRVRECLAAWERGAKGPPRGKRGQMVTWDDSPHARRAYADAARRARRILAALDGAR